MMKAVIPVLAFSAPSGCGISGRLTVVDIVTSSRHRQVIVVSHSAWLEGELRARVV